MDNNTLPLVHGMILDMDRPCQSRTVLLCRTGDNRAHMLNITLSSGGEPMAVPANACVTLYARRADGSRLWSSCTVNEDGSVSHLFTSSELEVPGKADCELYIVTPEREMTSPKFRVTVEGILRDDSAVFATDDFSVLGDLIAKAEKAVLLADKAPDSATAGSVGAVIIDSTDGTFYKCTGAVDGAYTWVKLNKVYLLTVHKPAEGESFEYLVPSLREICNDSPDCTVFLKYHDSETSQYYTVIPALCSNTGTGIVIKGFYTNPSFIKYAIRIYYKKSSGSARVEYVPEYAPPSLIYDEDYYLTAPPTVEAVDYMIKDKQDCAIADSEGYFTEKTVEGALKELGASLCGADSALDGILSLIGGNEA
ncbi:MAG: hypothetical protein PUC29_01215 [Clostridia bacterium]|nr:hypothetical protein [Clostridia bacterium]